MNRISLLVERPSFSTGQDVRAFAPSGDHSVWAFPVGFEFSSIFFLSALDDPVQDQITNLIFIDLHFLVMCGPDLLLVGGDTD